MDLRETIRSTGAVRSFRPDPVPHDELVGVFDDARFAPSGGNRQPWRVAIIDDTDIRAAIGRATKPVWDDYMGAASAGQTPFNVVNYEPVEPIDVPNVLIDQITDTAAVPVVAVVAADLSKVAAMDTDVGRLPLAAGASLYPFCWNALLAARSRGLGGVLTTFAARVEPELRDVLALPASWAIGAVLFLGYPEHQPTKLRRDEPASFMYRDRYDQPVTS